MSNNPKHLNLTVLPARQLLSLRQRRNNMHLDLVHAQRQVRIEDQWVALDVQILHVGDRERRRADLHLVVGNHKQPVCAVLLLERGDPENHLQLVLLVGYVDGGAVLRVDRVGRDVDVEAASL